MKSIYVPWLHMHQPLVWQKGKLLGNLEKMLESDDQKDSWEAKLMIRAYKNPAKYVGNLREKKYPAKIMLDFSGLLLENLEKMKSKLKKMKVDGENIGDIIKFYKDVMNKYSGSIEFSGTAYSHCYFPVTPERDWGYQIEEWRNTFEKLFGKEHLKNVKGFWLPEMGIPGDEDKLYHLIKLVKEFGYEWMILPIEALKNEKQMGFEERVIKTSQPHLLKAGSESIPVIFRVRYDFIDQQAGCDANGVHEKCLLTAKIFNKVSDKPSLVVPASDGENGNVMMNEFFPSTFEKFFKENIDDNVSSMTVSEFLKTYYPKIESEIKLSGEGSSWIGSHKNWQEGDERIEINKKISKLSERFERTGKKLGKIKQPIEKISEKYQSTKNSLLITETSCYTYWGTEFWFDQARKSLKSLEKKLDELDYLLDRNLYFERR
ncbi:MAG: glycoside hydrolase [Candidatus Aenigmarchaeota archaeon]|nr:glycoside hydrolase [Candidatus Aenigmarchaeota archaeon]